MNINFPKTTIDAPILIGASLDFPYHCSDDPKDPSFYRHPVYRKNHCSGKEVGLWPHAIINTSIVLMIASPHILSYVWRHAATGLLERVALHFIPRSGMKCKSYHIL